MALSNFAVNAPNLAQYSALSELKPLSFAGGMQSPLEFRTMSAIRPPDAQPEAVAQGIGKALGSVAEGITAAFKSKADEKKDQLKYQRDKELARVKAQAEADYRQETLNETKRYHDMLGQQAAERIDKVTPKQGKSLATRSLDGLPPLPESTGTAETPTTEKIRIFGNDPETEYMKRDADVTNDGVPLSMTEEQTKALSSLTPDISEPSNRKMLTADLAGSSPYTGLSDLAASKIFATYNASSSPLGIPNSAPVQALNELTRDEIEQQMRAGQLAEQKQFGTLPLQNITPVQEAGTNNAMEDAIGIDALYSEQDALALRNYAKAKGIPANLKATENGYEVTWPSQSEIEKYRENLGGKKSAKDKTPKEIFDEEDKMRGDYVSQSKNFQTIQSAWNNLKGKIENPTGASDMSLIFAYMKLLDPTSTIREGEYATASNVGTIPQTFIGKYNKAVEGNGFLDQKVRESFINEAKKMYQSSLSQHKQNTSEVRRIAKSYGLDPDRVIIDLVTKDEAEGEMEALGQELNAVADKDRATYPDFQAKRARFKALLAKKQDQDKLSKQPNTSNTQTPSVPQKPNNTKIGVFSNLVLPKIF